MSKEELEKAVRRKHNPRPRGWETVLLAEIKKHRERFMSKIEKTASCWNWTAAKINGYGAFSVKKKQLRAHRVSWVLLRNEPLPEGMVIDHLCRNRGCVNPDHMDCVSVKTNTMRGIGPQERQPRQRFPKVRGVHVMVQGALLETRRGYPMTPASALSRLEKLAAEKCPCTTGINNEFCSCGNCFSRAIMLNGGKALLQILSEPGEACGPRVRLDYGVEAGSDSGYWELPTISEPLNDLDGALYVPEALLLQARAEHELEVEDLRRAIVGLLSAGTHAEIFAARELANTTLKRDK